MGIAILWLSIYVRWRRAVAYEGEDVESEWDGLHGPRFRVPYRRRVVRYGRNGRRMNHKFLISGSTRRRVRMFSLKDLMCDDHVSLSGLSTLSLCLIHSSVLWGFWDPGRFCHHYYDARRVRRDKNRL